MKILIINVVCGIRSTGRICTDLAEEFCKDGHIVRIAYGRDVVPVEYRKYAVRIGSNFDVIMHGLKARFFDLSGFGSINATKKFIDWIKTYNPDVIHLHNLHGYYINIELLFDYLRTCGKKIIWTMHDCWAFTGHSAYCDISGCQKWINGCCNCPNKNEYPASVFDLSSRNYMRKKQLMNNIPNMIVVTPSNWLKNLVGRSILSEYPVEVINNGIDTEEFKPVASNFRKDHDIDKKKVLLGVASLWEKRKGLSDFLKLSEMVDDSVIIVLVGLTKKQIKKIPSNIIGIERTNSRRELAEIYSAADLYLNLTYEDNYPTTNLEAIACGVPVLTYKTGGSPESAFGGIVVDQGDLEAVVFEINRLETNRKMNCIVDRNEISKSRMLEKYQQIIIS